MELPYVSCICPTYGRFPRHAHLLNEAVESYLRQDYPADRRELIVLNDSQEQILKCNAPGVRVVNWSSVPHRSPGQRARNLPANTYFPRFDSLGSKYNCAITISSGELLMPWEDDDISLPHRISTMVKMLGDADYANPKAYWFMNHTNSKEGIRLQHEQNTGYAHSASIFRRSAWKKVGGYPDDCKQDAGMDSRLRDPQYGLKVVDGPLSREQTGYIYRWGVSDHHVSAFGNPEQAYAEYGKRPVVAGEFQIIPRWEEDYVALTKMI